MRIAVDNMPSNHVGPFTLGTKTYELAVELSHFFGDSSPPKEDLQSYLGRGGISVRTDKLGLITEVEFLSHEIEENDISFEITLEGKPVFGASFTEFLSWLETKDNELYFDQEYVVSYSLGIKINSHSDVVNTFGIFSPPNRDEIIINPFHSVGSIHLNESSSNIIDMLTECISSETQIKYNERDRSIGVNAITIHLDQASICEAVSVASRASSYLNLTYKNVPLLGRRYGLIYPWILSLDPNLILSDVGLTSLETGICLWGLGNPKLEPYAYVEAVIIFRQGYYEGSPVVGLKDLTCS